MSDSLSRMRLDKWLWAARFYKTRGLAAEAINGGHVKLNGQRAKPGARLQIGDRLSVRKQSLDFVVTIEQLALKRGSSSVAQQLYSEDAASRQQREAEMAARREQAYMNPRPKRKPNKRERGRIIRFVNKYRQEER